MSLLNLSAIIKALWSLIFSLALNNVAAQSTGNEINYFKVVTGRKRQNILGEEPCQSVRLTAVNTRQVRFR